MERRNYDEFVKELLAVQKVDPGSLESHIDSYQNIVAVEQSSGISGQLFHHSFSTNLVELIKSLIRWDRTSSLKHLARRVTEEVAKVPFELHLALSLSQELVKPSAGSMFYFPYLEELLTFVDNATLFFRFFRLFTLERVSATGPSRLESLTAYKLASRFGDAEDMEYLSACFTLQSVVLKKDISEAIRCSNELQVSVCAYHTEQLPFHFEGFSRSLDCLPTAAAEAAFLQSTSKLCKLTSLVVSSNQGTFLLDYRGFQLLVSQAFLMIVGCLARSDSADYSQIAADPLAKCEVDRFVALGLLQKTVECSSRRRTR